MKSQPLTRLKILERPQPSGLVLALKSFLLDAEARRLTPKTLHYYRQQLQPFLDYLDQQGVRQPQGIAAFHIRSYLVALQRRGLADASQHAAARAIRAFGNFMVREEMLESSPMRKVKMPKMEQPILPAFAPEDVRRLLAVCDTQRDRAIILCLLDSGCRAAEFVGLDVGDVDTMELVGTGFKTKLVFDLTYPDGEPQRTIVDWYLVRCQ